MSEVRSYIMKNLGYLLVPILVFNLIFYVDLPKLYHPPIWDEVPIWILSIEVIGRIILFGAPFFFTIQFSNRRSKATLLLFVFGTMLYFASWLMLCYFPNSSWSLSNFGLTGPAWSAALWLIPLGLLIQPKTRIGRYIRIGFWIALVFFMIAHVGHSIIVT